MDVILYFSIICLLVLAIVVSIQIYMKKGLSRINYLRRFKKGKGLLVYFICIPLYMVGYAFSIDTGSGHIFLDAMNATMKTIVLRIDFSDIQMLLDVSILYQVAMSLMIVMVICNACLLGVSVFGQSIVNGVRLYSTNFFARNIYYVLGMNDESMETAKSIRKNKRSKVVIIDKLSREEKDIIFAKGIGYYSADINDWVAKFYNSSHKIKEGKNVRIIVNQSDYESRLIVVDMINKTYSEENTHDNITAFLLVNSDIESVFDDYVKLSNGKIKVLDKAKLLANDFIFNYPMTLYMSDKQLDYETATIKPEIQLNSIFIGFGDTNREIFLASRAVNQFLQYGEKGLVEKRVKYSIFDKNKAKNSIKLNHNYFKYRDFYNKLSVNDEFTIEKNDVYSIENNESQLSSYLPLPIPYSRKNERFLQLDFNQNEFYNEIFDIVSRKDAFTHINISLGSDLINIDIAEKLKEKLKEWDCFENIHIFVKIKNKELYRHKAFDKQLMTSFGCNADIHSIEMLENDSVEKMAIERKYEYQKGTVEGCKYNNSRDLWYEEDYDLKRGANHNCCIALRMKLNLLGLDIAVSSSTIENVSLPKIYTEQNSEFVARQNLAILEHNRWNEYLITCGFLPLPKSEICSEYTKHYGKRVHSCITTWDGLDEYAILAATDREDPKSVLAAEVKSYDYQIMDQAEDILKLGQFKIIKKVEK